MFEDRREKQRTELAELGEFGLIDRLTRDLKIKNSSTIKGVGDDCAVLDYGGSDFVVITTDILTEGVHFDLTYTPLKHLGYKAVAVNVSDIYAMNGTPKQIVVGISLSNRFSLEAIEELYEGMQLACTNYGVDLVGGDTTASKAGLFISITAVGSVAKDKVTHRKGAVINDLICVSGDLGAAYSGLLILEREKSDFLANPNMQPDIEPYSYVLERQLKPEARKDVIRLLNDGNIIPTSMIDISDGLASEILHICKASKIGCQVYEDKIPIDPATVVACESFEIDPTTAALNGGEDYELLFTVKQEDYDKIKSINGIAVIGHITDENSGVNLVTRSGQQVEIKAQGFKHI